MTFTAILKTPKKVKLVISVHPLSASTGHQLGFKHTIYRGCRGICQALVNLEDTVDNFVFAFISFIPTSGHSKLQCPI
jgi:hypothetical protein